MKKLTFIAVVVLNLAAAPVAIAQQQMAPSVAQPVFVTREQLDLTRLLAPPPALDSEAQKRDLAALLAIQSSRTSRQVERALADATAGTFGFADVLGASFTAERLPKIQALFKKIEVDGTAAFSAGQSYWKRPRPFDTSHEINALGDLPKSPSFPSGASMIGYLTGIMLANMVPEKSAALFARGRELGDDRLILGVHYPSDVEAGRLAATAAANAFLQNSQFMKEFDEAKLELRQALGL